MQTNYLIRALLLLILLAALVGCESSDNSTGAIEQPEPLPTAFTDFFGETWTCISSEETQSVQGQVRFASAVNLNRSDILHISLIKISDDQLSLIATQCVNNILATPQIYQIFYNNDLIDVNARYVLSTVFFARLTTDTYIATHKPDGFLEVINNGLVTNADIVLDAL